MGLNPDLKKSDLLLARAKRVQEQAHLVEVDEEKLKLVIFLLGKDYYAFLGSAIKEIIPFEKITSVPGAPDFILGMINIRGDIESVLNIRRMLDLPDGEITAQSRIAVAERGALRSGVLVDLVEDVLDFPAGMIKPPLPTLDPAQKEFVIGEAVFHHRNVTVLDVAKILEKASHERISLER